MTEGKGYIYLRDNDWYRIENVLKMGISKIIYGRGTTYITGEITRGEFILIILIIFFKYSTFF